MGIDRGPLYVRGRGTSDALVRLRLVIFAFINSTSLVECICARSNIFEVDRKYSPCVCRGVYMYNECSLDSRTIWLSDVIWNGRTRIIYLVTAFSHWTSCLRELNLVTFCSPVISGCPEREKATGYLNVSMRGHTSASPKSNVQRVLVYMYVYF